MDSTDQQDDHADKFDEALEEVGGFLDRTTTLYKAAKSLDNRGHANERGVLAGEEIYALLKLIHEEAQLLDHYLSDEEGYFRIGEETEDTAEVDVDVERIMEQGPDS